MVSDGNSDREMLVNKALGNFGPAHRSNRLTAQSPPYIGKAPHTGAALAQLVEHRIRNAGVACSSHAGGTIFFQNIRWCRASGVYPPDGVKLCRSRQPLRAQPQKDQIDAFESEQDRPELCDASEPAEPGHL